MADAGVYERQGKLKEGQEGETGRGRFKRKIRGVRKEGQGRSAVERVGQGRSGQERSG